MNEPKRDRFALTLIVVAISAFMITMDNTVVIIVKEAIQVDLHTTESTLEWVVTGYILIFSCLMIPGGRLVDVYGQRIIFTIGMLVFTAASLMAGFSGDIGVLTAARLLQGAGAALALPATMVAVTVGRTDKQKSLGMIVWVGTSAAAAALGPAIGAIIKSLWGWQGIFFVNVAPGVLVILMALLVLNGAHDTAAPRVDLPGVLTSATTLFTLTYALTEGPRLGWTDPAVISVFALAAIALLSLVMVERWAPDPIFDTSFFRNKIFSGALISQILMGLGFNGVMYFGTTFMQKVLGFSDTQKALVLLPPAITIGALTPLSFWVAGKIGPRLTIGGGMVLIAVGMFLFGLLHQGDTVIDLMPGVLLLGAGSAMGMPLAMYVLKSVPEERSGVASGILNVGREMSGGLGIAVLGAFILSIQNSAKHTGVADGEAFRQGAAVGLPIGAAIVLVGGLIAVMTMPGREKVARHRKQNAQRLSSATAAVAVPAFHPEPVTAGAGRSQPPPWPPPPPQPPLQPPPQPPRTSAQPPRRADPDPYDDPYDPFRHTAARRGQVPGPSGGGRSTSGGRR
ncbi:MAG: major facilitator superfamily 1 [Streptosporangiaceae bacterium]|jgi:EmrB/QacA subfamily drug resistance transporter|nr:major facilitator superfamily 1 [Streptosporangiaceae bacterium]